MAKKASLRGRDWNAAKEGGHVLRAYLCPARVWTISVGLTAASGVVKPRRGMTITREESERLYEAALTKYERRVDSALPGVPQHAFDGSLSFDFNTGRIHDASWAKKLIAGDFAGSERSLLSWNKARGKVLRGLTLRRKAEADLIFRGRYDDGGPVDAPGRHDSNNRVPPLRRGNAGGAVKQLQEELTRLGYGVGEVDGMFGPSTEKAVRDFQRDHPDLTADGIAGAATMSQIQRALDARSKGGKTAAGGAVAAGGAGGGNEVAGGPDVTGIPTEWLVGGVGVLVLAAVLFIGWQYGDVLRQSFNRLWRRG